MPRLETISLAMQSQQARKGGLGSLDQSRQGLQEVPRSPYAPKSNDLLRFLESFFQRSVPLTGIDPSHSHPQRFLASH